MKKVVNFLKILITIFLLASLASSVFAVYTLNITPDKDLLAVDPNYIVKAVEPDDVVEPNDVINPVEPGDVIEPTNPNDVVNPVEPNDVIEPSSPDDTVEPTEPDYVVKNVIIMIGDGMGQNHIEATRRYLGVDKLNMEKLPYKGLVKTSSILQGGEERPITDSAAAATALATGFKTQNGMVGVRPDYARSDIDIHLPENLLTLPNVTERAIATGRKTGIVATKNLSDATPAGFSAHVAARGQEAEIAKQQVYSGIDVMMGAGYSQYYLPLTDELLENGYQIATSYETLVSLTSGKVYGGFNSINYDSIVNLEVMVEQSLKLLDNEDGFFAMFEGSKIDTYGHSNNIMGVINETRSFDNAVGIVMEYIEDNPDTLLIVTADHETGGLQDNLDIEEGIINYYKFTSTGHSDQEVFYFMYGHGAETVPANIDNTDIAKLIFRALG